MTYSKYLLAGLLALGSWVAQAQSIVMASSTSTKQIGDEQRFFPNAGK